MNLDNYWQLSPPQLALAQFTIWGKLLRPMVGLFYMPRFHLFGLNPAPYHAALLAILLLTTFLVWRLAIVLAAGETAVALAALIAAYHSDLSTASSSATTSCAAASTPARWSTTCGSERRAVVSTSAKLPFSWRSISAR